jgi:hypothetical protein
VTRQRSNWVVAITEVAETGDTETYGPYTRTRAEEIEAAMERFFENEPDPVARPLVSAYPLQAATIPQLKEWWS